MTREGKAGTRAPGHVVECPTCRQKSRGSDRICARCWRPLSDAPEVDEAPDPRPQQGAATRRRRLAIGAGLAVLLVVVPALVIGLSRDPGIEQMPAPSASVAAAAQPGAWPVPAGSLQGSRAVAAEVQRADLASWETRLPSDRVAPIVGGPDTLYLALHDGTLRALASEDGAERWSHRVPGRLDSAPLVTETGIILPGRDGTLTAVEGVTGEVQWTWRGQRSITSTPIVVEGVVVAAMSGRLVGVDGGEGSLLWDVAIPEGPVVVTPAADAGVVAVAVHGWFALIDVRAGDWQFDWELAPRHGAIRALTITQDHVVITAERALLVADRAVEAPWWVRGYEFWRWLNLLGLAPSPTWAPFLWTVGVSDVHPPAASDAVAILASRSGTITAYDIASGEELWAVSGDRVSAPPLLALNGLLVARGDELVLLDRDRGTEVGRWSVGVESDIEDVALLGDRLVLGLAGGQLVVLPASGGE